MEGLAVPHSFEMNDLHTDICVTVLDKPISWSEKHRVRLIISMAVSKEDRIAFSEVFEYLIELPSEEGSIKELARSHDHTGFMERLFAIIDVHPAGES